MKQYVNLHNHTHGSLLDGISRPPRYAKQAKVLEQPAIAVTEHGNLHTLLDMYDSAKAEGLKFIPGQEFYQARKTRFDRDPDELSGRARSEWDQRGPYHLTVLAVNNTGYHNLLKLSSRAYTEGLLAKKARIDHQLLSEHSEGLVVLSGCLSGELQQAIRRDDMEGAFKTAETFRDIMGKDNYFIEIMDHDIPEEKGVHEGLIRIAKELDLPIIATCDSHYTLREEYDVHDTSLCINTKAKKHEEERFKFANDNFYLKSYEEMAAIFPEEYLDNSMLVYDKLELDLQFGEFHFPQFKTPDDEPVEKYFPKRVHAGSNERFGLGWGNDPVIVERLKYEMNIIKELKFENYFLVVDDIVNWAKDNDIMVGPSRGSVGGCLLAYVLGITEINPLKYGLSFDRFLVYKPATENSPAEYRNEPPDIDLDFEDRYRDKVMDYARSKYGFDHCANIGTFGKIGAAKAVRDVCRVLDFPYELGDKLSKAMPGAKFGVAPTLERCFDSPEFKTIYETNADARTIVDQAMKLEGMYRDVGMHAAGLLIADAPITDYIPVLQTGEGKPLVAQWEMGRTEQAGLLKIDFLALANLSIIKETCRLVKEIRGIDVGNPYELLDDPDTAVFEALSRGDVIGVFQMESDGMKDLIMSLKPVELADVAALLALYRPGPMGSNVHNEYAARKNGRRSVEFLHESLKPILEDTYGLMLYQEQLLQIAQRVAGKNIMEADELRKIVGKKIISKMPQQRGSFVEGCVKTAKMPKAIAEKLFDEIEHHASYSFGAGHAFGYSFISYITSYLKIKYPLEYMAATLSIEFDNKKKFPMYLEETKRMGIKVRRPSINYSDHGFSIRDGEIFYGLDGINGFGQSSVDSVLANRDDEPYANVFDFLRRTNPDVLNRKTLIHLLKSGALDEILTLDELDGELHRNEKIGVLFDEADQLGIFLVEHPFSDLKDLVIDKRSHSLKEIGTHIIDQTIRVAGIVRKVEKKKTRAGKTMYILSIQDDTSSIDVVVFPKVAEKLPETPFNNGDLLVVEGRVRLDNLEQEDAKPNLIYQSHEKIEYGDVSTTPTIFLEPKKPMSSVRLTQIRDIIKGSKGSCKVMMRLPLDDEHFVVIKFEQTTSLSVENTLRKLIEV